MAGHEYNLIQLFGDGGIFMYPLLLCSLVGLGVIIAKAYMLLIAHRGSNRIMSEAMELYREGKVGEAIEMAVKTPGPVAAILLTALRRVQEADSDSTEIEHAIKTTGAIEVNFLERGLNVLATVSTVAPLIGFLGTVAGMIEAFSAIANAGQVEAALVAGGIKIALITTATGLIIAIPMSLAHNFYVTRIDRLIQEMEKGTAAVLRLVWNSENLGHASSQPLPSE